MKRHGMFVVLHRFVGRALCWVGLHRLESKNAPTLRCVRRKKIVCLWAIGLARSGFAEKLRKIDAVASKLVTIANARTQFFSPPARCPGWHPEDYEKLTNEKQNKEKR